MSTLSDQVFDDDSFNAQVAGLVNSFGDPTRRAIYLFIRQNPGATANDLSSACNVHPNVVRHHLDRLSSMGYVELDVARRTGVGRPAKTYRTVDDAVVLDGSPRRDTLLVALLERALEMLGPEATEKMALEVGLSYGAEISARISPSDSVRSAKAAMAAVADVLTSHGFAARSVDDETHPSVIAESCPFGAAATHHPVLCAVDRGLITGILEGIGSRNVSITLTSRARGDLTCQATA